MSPSGLRRQLPLKKKQAQEEEEEEEDGTVDSNNNENNNKPPPQIASATQNQQNTQHQQESKPNNNNIQQDVAMNQPNGKILSAPMEINGQVLETYLYGQSPVTDPHIHDVLCGRGALTNEHPGNEW
jgi:hypothetical protein